MSAPLARARSARALIDRVRSFDRDAAAYKRLVADDLARARFSGIGLRLAETFVE